MAKVAGHYKEDEFIHRLASLLRQNGERILSGQSKLSLTTGSLVILQRGFHSISDDNVTTSFEVLPSGSPKLSTVEELQFLYDFVQKTLALKVLHEGDALHGSLSIASFRALRVLELKKTPLQHLTGLQKLRGKLHILICTRCLIRPQDLFEWCGGDMSSTMSWPELREAYLSFNKIQKLDNSLRLLPILEVLDLSHNRIESTEAYLQYLTELVVINLGFNLLEKVPLFSLSAKARIRTLDLRNNNLEDLVGLDELTSLVELDLGNNCLSDHSCLEPLKQLGKLQLLQLIGNPLSHHTQHRFLTAQRLHSLVAKQVVLDGACLTRKELKQLSRPAPHSLNRFLDYNNFEEGASYSSVDHSDFRYQSSSDTTDLVFSKKKGKGKKSKKPRSATISELDSTGEDLGSASEKDSSIVETPYGSAQSSTGDSQQQMKEKLEVIRQQMGPDWLQGLAVAQAEGSSGAVNCSAMMYGANYASGTQIQSSVEVHQPQETEDALYLKDTLKVTGSASESFQSIPDDYNTDTPQEALPSNQASDETLKPEAVESAERLAESENFYELSRKSSEVEEVVDYGVESDPFIVNVLTDDSSLHGEQLLLCVSERYLVEKDLNGQVVEALDLRCLQSTEGDSQAEVKLTFDYVKKDRRERRYAMEDQESAKQFLDLVGPTLNTRLMDQLQEMMQCFKCEGKFHKQEAMEHIRSSKQDNRRDVFNSEYTESLACPFCSSTVVLKLEERREPQRVEILSQAGDSNFTTPVGSPLITANSSPMATSSAKPSPLVTSKVGAPKAPEKVRSELIFGISEGSFKSLAGDEEASSPGNPALANHISPSIPCTKPADPKPAVAGSGSYYGQTPPFSYSSSKGTSPHPMFEIGGEICSISKLHKQSKVERDAKRQEQLVSQTLLESRDEATEDVETDDSRVTGQAFRRSRVASVGSDIIVLHSHDHHADISHSAALMEADLQEGRISADLPNSEADSSNDKNISSEALSNELLASESLHVSSPSLSIHGGKESSLDASPCGSLNNKTLSSMVTSMYESSIYTSNSQLGTSGQSCDQSSDSDHQVVANGTEPSLQVMSDAQVCMRTSQSETSFVSIEESQRETGNGMDAVDNGSKQEQDSHLMKYNYVDFSQVDHRLKLHLNMKVFKGNEEDVALVLRCGVSQFKASEEISGLVAISNEKIYILKVTGSEECASPDKWLKLVQTFPIIDLQFVDIGIGNQTVRLDFGSESSCFTLLLRDERRCKQFMRQFTRLVQGTAMHSSSKLQGISKSQPETRQNLEVQVLLGGAAAKSEDDEVDMTVVKYVMAHQKVNMRDTKRKDSLPSSAGVSVVVTLSHIFLTVENFNVVPPRSVATAGNTGKGQQFEFVDRQSLLNITAVDQYNATNDLTIHFMEEDSGQALEWEVTMETLDAMATVVNAIKTPWQEAFAVELQVNYLSR